MFPPLYAELDVQTSIEPNRCAMAWQGCGAAFAFLQNKNSDKLVKRSYRLSATKNNTTNQNPVTVYEKITMYLFFIQEAILHPWSSMMVVIA